jgi:hypothetical protein
LWILEEVGCCLQEGVPLCKNGMAQGKRLQENSDPGKLWTAEGIGHWQKDDPAMQECHGTREFHQEVFDQGQC